MLRVLRAFLHSGSRSVDALLTPPWCGAASSLSTLGHLRSACSPLSGVSVVPLHRRSFRLLFSLLLDVSVLRSFSHHRCGGFAPLPSPRSVFHPSHPCLLCVSPSMFAGSSCRRPRDVGWGRSRCRHCLVWPLIGGSPRPLVRLSSFGMLSHPWVLVSLLCVRLISRCRPLCGVPSLVAVGSSFGGLSFSMPWSAPLLGGSHWLRTSCWPAALRVDTGPPLGLLARNL